MKAAAVVLIHGAESFLIDRELRDIEKECGITSAEDMNRQLFEASETDSSAVINSARTLPFMGTKRLIIVKNAGAWKAESWDSLARYLEKPNPSTTLVLVVEKPDKRRAVFKLIKEKGREFEAKEPADSELMGWARRMAEESGLELDPRVAQSLIMRVGTDLQTLWREIQKLRAFAGDGGRLTVDDVEKLVGDSRSSTVFVLCDAVGSQNARAALAALKKLLELGEEPIKINVMIARHFRGLAKARQLKDEGSGIPQGQMAQIIGVPPFAVRKTLEQAGGWSAERLEDAFRRLLRADLGLKSGGGEEVMEKLVLDLCASGRESRRGRQGR